MDFSQALTFLKEGKTLTRPCMRGGYINLIIKIYRDSAVEETHVVRVNTGNTRYDSWYIPIDWLLATDWEIVDDGSKQLEQQRKDTN